jgi:hypothetical protein
MNKILKIILPTITLGLSACAVIPTMTACKPIYLILRDIDFSNGDVGGGSTAPVNSRIIDATNTLFYLADYDFSNNPNDVPDGVRAPLRIAEAQYLDHYVLFAGDVAYTIKVTAAINYEGTLYRASITVNVKAQG